MSREPRLSGGRWPPVLGPRSQAASALRMSRREMLGERQVAASLMAQRAAHGALRLAYRRFQPGESVGIQLAGLRLSGKPQRPSQCQFGHETLVLAFALFAPAASRPGQHCAVRRRRWRQVAPCGHTSTVGQRFLRLVLRVDILPRLKAGGFQLLRRLEQQLRSRFTGRAAPSPPRAVTACPAAMFLAAFTSAWPHCLPRRPVTAMRAAPGSNADRAA